MWEQLTTQLEVLNLTTGNNTDYTRNNDDYTRNNNDCTDNNTQTDSIGNNNDYNYWYYWISWQVIHVHWIHR